jgi:hypothetical protein
MSLKTTVCAVVEPQAKAVVDPNTGKAHPAGVCPGDYIRHETGEGRSVTINKKVYTCWEQCQKCGNLVGIA